jgi:hypothetical protein
LPRTKTKLAVAIGLAMLALIVIQPLMVSSQTTGALVPRFGETIVALHRAESAGATSGEIGELVVLLNNALALNVEALRLNAPSDAPRRTELLAQVDQILTTVANRAAQLTSVAAQRTFTNKVLAYVGGAIAAGLGTVAYAFLASFYQRYRVKRTFEMRVTRK